MMVRRKQITLKAGHSTQERGGLVTVLMVLIVVLAGATSLAWFKLAQGDDQRASSEIEEDVVREVDPRLKDAQLLDYVAFTGDMNVCSAVEKHSAYYACTEGLWKKDVWNECSANFYAGLPIDDCWRPTGFVTQERALCRSIYKAESAEACTREVITSAVENGNLQKICGTYDSCYYDATFLMGDITPCEGLERSPAGRCQYYFATKHTDISACDAMESPRKASKCRKWMLNRTSEVIPYCEENAWALLKAGREHPERDDNYLRTYAETADNIVISEDETMGNCLARTYNLLADETGSAECLEFLELMSGNEFVDEMLQFIDLDMDGEEDDDERWYCEDELNELFAGVATEDGVPLSVPAWEESGDGGHTHSGNVSEDDGHQHLGDGSEDVGQPSGEDSGEGNESGE